MKISLREALAEKLNRTQEVAHKDHTVREMAEKLMSLTDEQYGRYAFFHEPLERKFDAVQKKEYIRQANTCGREIAASFSDGSHSPDPESIAERLGAAIVRKDMPVGGGHVIFAQYTEPDHITIFRDCLKRLEEMIRNEALEDLFEGIDFEKILLAHELYHVIEFQNKDTIFSQTETIELWKRPFSNRSRILALSEIAAMAFAREVNSLAFSPYLLDVLLIAAYNHEAACALYEEILEAAMDS